MPESIMCSNVLVSTFQTGCLPRDILAPAAEAQPALPSHPSAREQSSGPAVTWESVQLLLLPGPSTMPQLSLNKSQHAARLLVTVAVMTQWR